MATIQIINDNLLNTSSLLICHQVNCQGVMGSGLAKQIRNKYPQVFNVYKRLCNKYQDKELLGNCQPVLIGDKCIVNLFGQLNYGTKKQQTDYNALKKSLKQLKYLLEFVDPYIFYDTIALPYNMGCGLAGGDWRIVFDIITKVFYDWDGEIYIYKR